MKPEQVLSDEEILGEAPPDDCFHEGWHTRWLRFGRDIEALVRKRLADRLRAAAQKGGGAVAFGLGEAARIVEADNE